MEQRELVARAQRGDHDAFCALARGALTHLFASARLILHDSERAEDAVQEALITAWRDIRGLRDPDRLDAWLHRLVVRSCYRVAGRERRHAASVLPILDADAPRVSDDAGLVAERDRMGRAFGELRPEQRAILVLVYYADLPLAEAAAALDIPLGTAKSRLHRACQALRAVLEADERLPLAVSGATR
jgi:RNA polymerase sigma-70 factor (ECF subfamily)